MTPSEFLSTILDPGLVWCGAVEHWTIPSDDRARVLMLAIAGQEGGWKYRVQQGNGPAHGFWQFERAGGVAGVLNNHATAGMANAACEAAGLLVPSPATAWGLMASEKGDNLAVAFARLLLWSDPAPLPALGEQDACWSYYERNWRPGKPGPDRWPANYQAAMTAVQSGAATS